MKQHWLLLVSWLIFGSLPLNDAHAQQRSVVRVALPGTIEPVILDYIGPAFTAATGYRLELSRAPSIALVNRIVSGELRPDVYISSDANQMELLFGPADDERARWTMGILRSRTALLYSPRSRFADDFEAARIGRLAWYQVLQRPGLVLKRPDPTVDSGGYRAIFVFELAEKHYRIPGLKARIIGVDNNETQYFDRTKDYPLLRNGSIDATVQFVTNALVGGVPYINLPEEVDQSDPALADWYATVSYTNPRGQTFQGAPAFYGVTILTAAENGAGAEAFVRFLLSESSLNKLERAGFLRTEIVAAGDVYAIPSSLRSLVRERLEP
ncbi:MAG TPA: extracellular solute-binding protein [Xanthobacteraceae bacterium]|nr:extracellular solute-binding protein [Xanthobacteraceae bacterium]